MKFSTGNEIQNLLPDTIKLYCRIIRRYTLWVLLLAGVTFKIFFSAFGFGH
jgi:hypothetical protein